MKFYVSHYLFCQMGQIHKCLPQYLKFIFCSFYCSFNNSRLCIQPGKMIKNIVQDAI